MSHSWTALLAVLAALSVLCSAAPVQKGKGPYGVNFPLFKQCDEKWGQDQMGVDGPGERATICREGCAMSSLAMALNGLGAFIGSDDITPGTLNKFLVSEQLYECAAHDCNNLILAAPEAISPRLALVGEPPKPSFYVMSTTIRAAEYIYLAHVRNRTHFVLLTDVASDSEQTFSVNDPGFNMTTYSYDDIADVIVYAVQNAAPSEFHPKVFPLFKQCDPEWGNDLIVTKTICDVGCLMSSISMAINGNSIQINGQASNPHTLNHFLQQNGGYNNDNDLDEAVVPKIDPSRISWPADGMHTSNDLSMETIRVYLVRGRVVIANVMKGRHFVLVTGWNYNNADVLYVNDPGFNNATYSISKDVVGWRIFDM